MAGAYIAAVAVRSRFAKLTLFNQCHLAAGLSQIPGRKSANDAATNDDCVLL